MFRFPAYGQIRSSTNLPHPPCGSSPERGEQTEPLDLRINYNFNCESPLFHQKRNIFHQNEILDLRINHNAEPFLHSVSESPSGIQYDSASKDTGNTCCGGSIIQQQNIPSVDKSKNQFGPTDKTINTIVSNYDNTTESDNFTLVSAKSIPKKVEKLSTERKCLQTIDSLTIKSNYESPNDTQLECVTVESVKDIPLLFESNILVNSSTNIHELLINNNTRDFGRKNVHKIDKSDCKSKKIKKVCAKKIRRASKMNQKLPLGECDVFNKGEHSMENNLGNHSQNNKDKEPSPKENSLQSCIPPLQNMFKRPSVSQLKKTGESFIQDGKCFEVAPKLPRCRECSLPLQDSIRKTQAESDYILCRFYAFRKLRYSRKGYLATAGFLDPYKDITQEDLKLWQPVPGAPPTDLDFQMARYMLSHLGDQFCSLCKQEDEAISVHISEEKTVAWKRLVPGFREMCDVCQTTLFNLHWTCKTCGFAVCIDCYKARKGCIPAGLVVERPWLICVNKRAHDQEKMMLTQIIAADSLKDLSEKAHEIRRSLGLPLHCCDWLSRAYNIPSDPKSDKVLNEFSAKNLIFCGEVSDKLGADKTGLGEKISCPDSLNGTMNDHSPSGRIDRIVSFEDYFCDSEKYWPRFYWSLRKKLNKAVSVTLNEQSLVNKTTHVDLLEEVCLTIFDRAAVERSHVRHHVQHCSNSQKHRADPMLTRVMTLTESLHLYPDCPHSWLCEGRLLKLSDPSHVGNYIVFQDQWKRGQPALVSGVLKFLDDGLWQPDSFIKDFGDTKNDLVNCMTGQVIPGQYMYKFWEGFQNVSKMLKDEKGNPMLLKLKDWPPGEDFAEMLPTRFEDLMKALPLGEYTKRTGQLNLPSRLPCCFVRPDLGPKMYIAYGSAIHPTKGTTNLHLDISDAVNVMVYVGVPVDIDREEYIKEAYKAVDEACSEMLTRRRVRDPTEVPGAIWHIYSARDADKIRQLLTKVARERRIKLGPHQDPIHDQSWYLDAELQQRLFKEYDVRGYAIVQCLGDAIFIPAGAPHQVRNLLNCIKVAEDFVSPENISHCFHLTQEFRKLSDFHTNHEDKLQIKNIIYHAVKDSVSVLTQGTRNYKPSSNQVK